MFHEIDNNNKKYLKILRQFQELLSNEKLKPGDKLPPERQLAETLGVSRPALRQALSILEAQNIIDCRQGDGNYVLPLSQNLFNPVVMGFYMNQGKWENILEFRYILEVNIIRLVTLKISEEQILELDQIVGRMENFQTLEIRKELNNTFHFSLIKMSGNSLVAAIYDSILSLIGDQISMTQGECFYDSHKKIVDAIKTGNPDDAAKCMIEHFTSKFPNYEYYSRLNR